MLWLIFMYLVVIATGVASRYVEYVKEIGEVVKSGYNITIEPFKWEQSIVESAKLPYHLFLLFKR